MERDARVAALDAQRRYMEQRALHGAPRGFQALFPSQPEYGIRPFLYDYDE